MVSIQWHEKEPVYALTFHPAGWLATAGADKEVNVRHACSAPAWRLIQGHAIPGRSAACPAGVAG